MRVELFNTGDWVRVTKDDGSDEWFTIVIRARSSPTIVVLDGDRFCSIQNNQIFAFTHSGRRRLWQLTVPYLYIERAIPSRNGLRIFALAKPVEGSSSLLVIDAINGQIVRSIPGIELVSRNLAETLDGTILVSGLVGTAPSAPWTPVCDLRLLEIDPASGEAKEERAGLAHDGGTFHSFSPSGRYALRLDARMLLQRRDSLQQRLRAENRATPLLKRLSRSEVQYGICAQLWETRPLRMVTRLVLGWYTEGELAPIAEQQGVYVRKLLPNGNLDSQAVLPPPPAGPVLAAISRFADIDAPPFGGFDRSAFPREYRSDEVLWAAVGAYASVVNNSLIGEIAWEADETGFWIHHHRLTPIASFRRISLEGTSSPLLQLTRQVPELYHEALKPLLPRAIVPLGDGRARIDCFQGHATIEARPSVWEGDRRDIGADLDGWVTTPDRAEHDRRWNTIERLQRQLGTHKIKLPDLSEVSCIAAIETLTEDIRERMHELVLGGEFKVRFLAGDRKLDEPQFYEHVRLSCPAAVPTLRRLIETYIKRALTEELGPRVHDYYWKGEQGVGSLSHAMLALALMDRGSFQLVHGFAECNDRDTSYFIPQTLVPTVIKHYGWDEPAVVELVAWMLLYDFYNTIQNANEVWTIWGMAKAVRKRYSPEQLAEVFLRNRVNSGDRSIDLTQDFCAGFDRSVTAKTSYEDEFLTRLRPRHLQDVSRRAGTS